MEYLDGEDENGAVVEIAAWYFQKRPEQITGYELISRSPYFNDILEATEKKLEIEITNYDRDCIVTVDDLIAVIGGKLSEKGAAHGQG